MKYTKSFSTDTGNKIKNLITTDVKSPFYCASSFAVNVQQGFLRLLVRKHNFSLCLSHICLGRYVQTAYRFQIMYEWKDDLALTIIKK